MIGRAARKNFLNQSEALPGHLDWTRLVTGFTILWQKEHLILVENKQEILSEQDGQKEHRICKQFL